MPPKLTFEEKKNKAYCLGFHLAAVRNFTGANAVITQGGIFISTFNRGLGSYTSIIINSIQFVSVCIGLCIASSMGKKPLFLISISLLALMNFGLVIAMIYDQVLALLIIMCLFMTIFRGWILESYMVLPFRDHPGKSSSFFEHSALGKFGVVSVGASFGLWVQQ